MNLPEQIIPISDKQYYAATTFVVGSDIRAYYHQLRKQCFHLRMHSHDFYEINIITRGSATHYLENSIIEAPLGTVFVIPPFHSHGYISDERTDIMHILLHPNFVTSYISDMRNMKGFGFLFDVEPILRYNSTIKTFLRLSAKELNSFKPRFDKLAEYKNINIDNKNSMEKFLALNIIAELCSLTRHATPSSKNNNNMYVDEMLEIINYINDNHKDSIDFHALANKYSMSYPTFYRHFKALINLSPVQYQLSRKINDAVQMISAGETSLTAISQECGFYDLSHFSKVFKKTKGISASEYIKRYQHNDAHI